MRPNAKNYDDLIEFMDAVNKYEQRNKRPKNKR